MYLTCQQCSCVPAPPGPKHRPLVGLNRLLDPPQARDEEELAVHAGQDKQVCLGRCGASCGRHGRAPVDVGGKCFWGQGHHLKGGRGRGGGREGRERDSGGNEMERWWGGELV